MEYGIKFLELSILKGFIGEHVARSFIRNRLAPKLAKEEGWDHVVFSHNDYKQGLKAGTKLFSFDRFRDDFTGYGFHACRKLLSRYAMVVGILNQSHCTPDGLLLKLRNNGKTKKLRALGQVSELPVVDGDLEVVEVKCGRSAKLMSKQKETYNNLIAKGIPLRLVKVKIVSFDSNEFLVEERRFERFL